MRRRPETSGRGNVLFIWGVALSILKWPRSNPDLAEVQNAVRPGQSQTALFEKNLEKESRFS